MHECHAVECDTEVPPRLFMCNRHWAMLPRRIKALVHRYYVKGQEKRKDPTWDYLYASQRVVEWLAEVEGVEHWGLSSGFEGAASDGCLAVVDFTIKEYG